MKHVAVMVCILLMACLSHAYDEYDEIDIHGFISQGYLQSDKYNFQSNDTEEGTFEYNEIGINFTTSLTDSLRLGIQFFAYDFGELGNDDIIVDYALAEYRYTNWLGIRVGKIKKPIGIYNQSRDVDAARTCVLLPSSIYHEYYRDVQLSSKGIGIFGSLPWGFDYQLNYGVFEIFPDGGILKKMSNTFKSFDVTAFSGDPKPSYTTQINYRTPLRGLILSAVAYNNDMDVESTVGEMNLKTKDYILSMEYEYKNFIFSTEYRGGTTTFTLESFLELELSDQAYYLNFRYRFNDFFELGTYYSVSYNNKDDKNGKMVVQVGNNEFPVYDDQADAWLKDIAISFRFDIFDNWIVKLEGHMMNGLLDVDYSDPTPSEDWFLYAFKVSYSF